MRSSASSSEAAAPAGARPLVSVVHAEPTPYREATLTQTATPTNPLSYSEMTSSTTAPPTGYTGRYTQSDPVWNAKRVQEINHYSYAAQNPMVHTDRLGLVTWQCSYNVTTGNSPIGPGAGVFYASCRSCACGTGLSVDLLGSVVGISAGVLPFGTSSSDIKLDDPFPCPSADSLAGKVVYAPAGLVPGAGISCAELHLGSADGRSCSFTVGLDAGLDAYVGAAAVIRKDRYCCGTP